MSNRARPTSRKPIEPEETDARAVGPRDLDSEQRRRRETSDEECPAVGGIEFVDRDGIQPLRGRDDDSIVGKATAVKTSPAQGGRVR